MNIKQHKQKWILIWVLSLLLLVSLACGSSTPPATVVTSESPKFSVPTEAPLPPKENNTLLCSQAPVGERVTCKIPHAYCSYEPAVKGSPTFCNDAPYPSQTFTLLRWGEDWSNLNNRCLVVTGYISLYKGEPQIEATNISQVQGCQ